MRTDNGQPFPADTVELSASNFGHFITPFEDLRLVKLTAAATDTNSAYVLVLADDLRLQNQSKVSRLPALFHPQSFP